MLAPPSTSFNVCSGQATGSSVPWGQYDPAGQGPAHESVGQVDRESGARPDGTGLSDPERQKNPASQTSVTSPSLIRGKNRNIMTVVM